MFDRVLPGRLEAFYLVGSVALGAFRPGRSDIDFVAVIDGSSTGRELLLLRALNWWGSALAVWWTLATGNRRWPAGLNGVFVTWKDLASSPCGIKPIASQRAGRFFVGSGFDVNPVTWQVLAKRGVAMRGPDAGTINVYSDPRELHRWVAANLAGYWASWSDLIRRPTWAGTKALFPRGVAWGVLGAPRLHATLATSEILSKEQAGEYALNAFPEWRLLIVDALAYWRGDSSNRWDASSFQRRRAAAEFVATVVADGAKRFSRVSADWEGT
ncbi:MAG: DUF4111 domain-containing protein [Candidatus Dormibacteraeota bacterium]|nr:DUF4111 domain-containing protein [Candidatus Dormibacteraeota bacterium]